MLEYEGSLVKGGLRVLYDTLMGWLFVHSSATDVTINTCQGYLLLWYGKCNSGIKFGGIGVTLQRAKLNYIATFSVIHYYLVHFLPTVFFFHR